MDADKIETELQLSAAEVIAGLSRGDGFDPVRSERLKQALRAAEQSWLNSDTISKSAAILFVDLARVIDSMSNAYKDDEAEQIRMLGDEVADLVRSCVAIPASVILGWAPRD